MKRMIPDSQMTRPLTSAEFDSQSRPPLCWPATDSMRLRQDELLPLASRMRGRCTDSDDRTTDRHTMRPWQNPSLDLAALLDASRQSRKPCLQRAVRDRHKAQMTSDRFSALPHAQQCLQVRASTTLMLMF